MNCKFLPQEKDMNVGWDPLHLPPYVAQEFTYRVHSQQGTLESSTDFRLLPAELGMEALWDMATPTGSSFSKKLTDGLRSSCSRLAELLGPTTCRNGQDAGSGSCGKKNKI